MDLNFYTDGDEKIVQNNLSVMNFSNLRVIHSHSFLYSSGLFLTEERVYPKFGSDIREDSIDLSRFLSLPVRLVDQCLVFQNWDVRTWGHFLIFMLPRLLIAQINGFDLSTFKILISSETPRWQLDILKCCFNISESNIVSFNPQLETVHINSAFVPEMPIASSVFPTGAREIFKLLRIHILKLGSFKHLADNELILIDRRPFLSKSTSFQRKSTNFSDLVNELTAIAPSIRVLDPSSLSIVKQAQLFYSASLVIGEYGSALHNSIFGREGLTVISIGTINSLQNALCSLMNQTYININSPSSGEFILPINDIIAASKKVI